MNKILVMFFIFLTSTSAYSKSTSHFIGKKFKAEVTYTCEEGELTCDKVYLKSTRIKDDSAISLKGSTVNSHCPDVCDFQGYRFTNGKYEYSFYPSIKGHDLWDYVITLDAKVIASDVGVMK